MLEDERLADVQAVAGIAKVERRYATKNMMLFNNGYYVTVMNTSTTQLTMQQPVVVSLVWPVSDATTACQDNLYLTTDIQSIVLSQSKAGKYSIYPYFSSTLEVSSYNYMRSHMHVCMIMHTKYNRNK